MVVGGKPEVAEVPSPFVFDTMPHDSMDRSTHGENMSRFKKHGVGGAGGEPVPNAPVSLDFGQRKQPSSHHHRDPVTSGGAFQQGSNPRRISKYAPNNASWKSAAPKDRSPLDGQSGNSNRVLERRSDPTIDDPTLASRSRGAVRDSSSRFSSYSPTRASWKSLNSESVARKPELPAEPNATPRVAHWFSSYAPNKASWKSETPRTQSGTLPDFPAAVNRNGNGPPASWKSSALELNKRVLFDGGKQKLQCSA